MSDQPIPQEVDPVRGLVEALKKAGAALRAASQEHHQCAACRHAADRVDDALASYRAWEEGGGSDSFQSEVWRWALECFGETIPRDMQERCDRFIEEALELVQSLGYDRERVGALTDYVFGRPAGEPSQEVGGAMVTLAALCSAAGLDMERAAKRELARIWTKMEVIRAKQAAKTTGSALPIPSPPASAPPEGWDNLTDAQRADIEAHIRGLSPGPETYTLDGPPRMWRCFHCGEIFRTTEGARLHFGDTPCAAPPPPAGVDRPETEGEKIAREALEPFKAIWDEKMRPYLPPQEDLPHPPADDRVAWGFNRRDITWGDFRRASEALALLAQQKERG